MISYGGFINDYIAGNLEANSADLNLHTSKINELFKDLEAEIKKGGFHGTDKLIDQIKTTISQNSGTVSEKEYLNLGTNLLTFIDLLLAEENGANIPSYATFLIKKIIYHYLNIAKTSKLEDIEQLSIKIADKYNSIWNN